MGICLFCEGEGDGDGAGRGAAWGRADVEQQQANRTAAAILIALLSSDVYHREECIDGPKGKLKSEARLQIERTRESRNNPGKQVGLRLNLHWPARGREMKMLMAAVLSRRALEQRKQRSLCGV